MRWGVMGWDVIRCGLGSRYPGLAHMWEAIGPFFCGIFLFSLPFSFSCCIWYVGVDVEMGMVAEMEVREMFGGLLSSEGEGKG